MINFSYSMFPTRCLLCVLCLVATAMGRTAASPPAKPQPPNVILITLDTVRADRMGFLFVFLGRVGPERAGPAPSPPAKPQPPNVILITLDTVRADRMGFLGSKRGLTPHLDALARQSVVFTHAYRS